MFKVIVLDDDPYSKTMIETFLKEYSSVNFEIVSDPLIAFEKIKTNQYDYIFIDHHMPLMCGTEFIRTFEGINLKGKVIILTGMPSEYVENELGIENFKIAGLFSKDTMQKEFEKLFK